MANWLDKALGRRSATIIKPVPFVRRCPCGQELSGLRQGRARRLICEQCGEPHFVLPVNLYPPSERIHFQPIEVGEFDAPQEYEDDLAPGAEPEMDLDLDLPAPAADRSSLRKLASDEGSVDDLETAELDNDDWDEEPPPRITVPSPRVERAGQRQKLLLVGSAFFVLVASMVVWVVWDRGQESAEIRLQVARDAGLVALEAGEFVTARREFAAALVAMDTLGVTGERRDSLYRLWLESEAAVGLTSRTLLQLVESANRTLREGTPEDWDAEFHTIFEGQWVLIDQTPLQIVPGGAGRKRLDFLWPVDDLPIHVAGIDALLTQTSDAERVLFAGQLVGCRRESNAWVVELNPENAFLWKRFRSLSQLGFASDVDEDLRDLIKAQAQLPDVTTTPTGAAENADGT